jgi:ABC-type branched-subunit amino acid transport system ATPase component
MNPVLEINNLSKRFGALVATDNVSFNLHAGESLALIGPNGAGKTTIFSQIMGEVIQSEGEIKLYGEEISHLKPAARIKRQVSRTYQVPRPFAELSVLENIRIGHMPNSIWGMLTQSPDLDYERELAAKVGLAADDLQRTPAELSMGDLRKLEMARTMATNPKVMLLDEVFAGLTTAEVAQISELILSMRADGMTFLIVSHDLPALKPLVDTAIAINQGREIARGTFDEVMTNSAVQSSYLGEL